MNVRNPLISLSTPEEKQDANSNTTFSCLMNFKPQAAPETIKDHDNTVSSKSIPNFMDSFRLTQNGLYYMFINKEDGEERPLWISSPFDIDASTSNVEGNNWGRKVSFLDQAGLSHSMIIPMDALAMDGQEVRKALQHEGLSISGKRQVRELLLEYFLNSRPKRHIFTANATGWNGNSYVMTDRSFDINGNNQIIYQNTHGLKSPYSQSGTIDDWKNNVSRLAIGNSRLLLPLSTAFAAPLMKLANVESGGIHLHGLSSSGKTTASKVACSVWGHFLQFMQRWSATANGLEGIAALHNDCLLPLDELGQSEPRTFANSIYMLANGQGKTRANSIGAARPAQQWNVMILSTGELTTEAHASQSGQRMKAGQVNRLANLEADAGKGMGIFEDIHDAATPNEFAQGLSNAAEANYGTVGLAWVEHLAHNRTTCTQLASHYMQQFIQRYVPKDAQGQVMRVAKRFALIAAAGEMATAQELTGWAQGEAMTGVAKCFNDWLMSFGGIGSHEEQAILSQVRSFIEAHGSSRFEVKGTKREKIRNRVGYLKTDTSNAKLYCLFPEQFRKEVCKGFDLKLVEKVLQKHGWLKNDERGGVLRKEYISKDVGATRLYVLIHHMVCPYEEHTSSMIRKFTHEPKMQYSTNDFGQTHYDC